MLKLLVLISGILSTMSFGKMTTIVGIVQTGADLATDMFDFIQSTAKPAGSEAMLEKYIAALDSSTELDSDILRKLDKIYETQSNIGSAKINLERWLRNSASAKNETNDASRTAFVVSATLALSGIRALPNDMVADVQGTNKKAIELFADEIPCRITDFNSMKNALLELVQDGMIIEFMYLKGSSPQNAYDLESEKQRWINYMEPVLSLFEKLDATWPCFQKMERCSSGASALATYGIMYFGVLMICILFNLNS